MKSHNQPSRSDLSEHTPQSAFFGYTNNKENFEIMNHLHFIFKYYLFKSRERRMIEEKYN